LLQGLPNMMFVAISNQPAGNVYSKKHNGCG
jgi:hypothetical protein